MFKKRRKKLLKEIINSLTINDFDFETSKIIKILECDRFHYNKKVNLDGTYSYSVYLPWVYEVVQIPKLQMSGDNVGVRMICSDEAWNVFKTSISDCETIEAELFTVKAKLNNKKIEKGLIKNKFFPFPFGHLKTGVYHFTFGRYNIPNLVTDKKPYGIADYENVLTTIKKFMLSYIGVTED